MGRWTEAARKKAATIRAAGALLSDEQAITVPAIFMPWDAMKAYTFGDRVRYGDLLYKCIAVDGVQPNPTWMPDVAVSLWVRIDDPAIEWPEWVQPMGAQDAYALGAKVAYNGKKWVSTASNNVWEPGTPDSGWEQV